MYALFFTNTVKKMPYLKAGLFNIDAVFYLEVSMFIPSAVYEINVIIFILNIRCMRTSEMCSRCTLFLKMIITFICTHNAVRAQHVSKFNTLLFVTVSKGQLHIWRRYNSEWSGDYQTRNANIL